jgi:DNA-binding PadR family transcriptional regulator
MDPTHRVPQSLLPLTPAVFHIMLALADGPGHGYGIMQEVTRVTVGTLRFGPGTLYGSLKRMLDNGLVEETSAPTEAPPVDDRRRYYQLTPFGRLVVKAEAERLEQAVLVARSKHLLPT